MTRVDYEFLAARRPEFTLPEWFCMLEFERSIILKFTEEEITIRCTEAVLAGTLYHGHERVPKIFSPS